MLTTGSDRIHWLAKQGWLDDNGLRHDATLMPAEEKRLVDLAKLLNPVRVWTVERQVITSTPGDERKGGQRTFGLVAFTLHATTAAEAGRLADDMKFQQEKARGHHHG